MRDTIFAVATAAGRAAVAVVRLSGPLARSVTEALCGGLPGPRLATLMRLRAPDTSEIIDKALVLWFPGPGSFTGEDCAEFQVHGGRAVLDALLTALGRFPSCRLAEAGEFTRRAFLNRKMDLAEVEGLADLIDAQTEAQRRQSLRQLEGALGRWVAGLRQTLLQALAATESAIDFADEADVAGDFAAEVRVHADQLVSAMADQLGRVTAAQQIREGLVVTLVGPPNAGKSTLLNALARRDVAIVSPFAGTTRDPVEVQLDFGGCLVTCIDTAGLRESVDPIEQEGMTRARARARSADLVLWLQDAREPQAADPDLRAARLWTVATKVDLAAQPHGSADFAVSAPSGQGLPALIDAIRGLVATGTEGAEAGLVTRLRHQQAIERARASLRPVLSPGLELELVAEHLRETGRHLDSLLGRIETDEVLGEIFARFCIGK